ncbi:hypothetical protein GOBAR_AA11253 [Gossypium barbadense]|uniref:Uncharacterized protein n=1 Tax=Gossypium barbadense TaxID=3634 RepID=A0A2P5Y1C6_GOSBA|nr:hypothetical protein GOBAR_AA11253 [Gossypium barbadense]
MLTKFISVSETCFQNTKTALKNQQASIQGLETQIGQLARLISERTQVSFPSNTESNPREQINTITIQDEEWLVAPELEPKQETMKSRTLDKSKSSQDELNTSPNQLKVRDKVQLDATYPQITTFEPNEEIPLTVLSNFPYGTVEVIHPKFGTFKSKNVSPTQDSIKFPRSCDVPVGNPTKVTRAIDMTVPTDVVEPVKITWVCTCVHGYGRSEQRSTWPCNIAVYPMRPISKTTKHTG